MQVGKVFLGFFGLLIVANCSLVSAADQSEIGDLHDNDTELPFADSEETALSAEADSELSKTKAVKQGTELDAEIDQALTHLVAAGLDSDKYLFLKEHADESVPAILQKKHELDGQLDFEIAEPNFVPTASQINQDLVANNSLDIEI